MVIIVLNIAYVIALGLRSHMLEGLEKESKNCCVENQTYS
jgi:hypothetical protein